MTRKVGDVLELPHVRAPGYATGAATHLALSASPDGMIHLTFFRDLVVPQMEKMVVHQLSPDGSFKVEVAPPNDETFKVLREDVATVSLARANLVQVYELIGKHLNGNR